MNNENSFGFNIIGFTSCNFGLGIAARNTISTLLKCKYNISVFDIEIPGRTGEDYTYKNFHLKLSQLPPYSVNLFHLNPPQIKEVKKVLNQSFMKGKFNICIPFWELSRIPCTWIPILEEFPLVLAPSHFIEYSVSSYTSNSLILHYPQSVSTVNIIPDRSRFGLSEKKFLFITSFDIGSDFLRKNPIGAIDSFRQAFPGNTNVNLIIKINKTVDHPYFNSLINSLKKFSTADNRIRIIDKTMSCEEILCLYSSCDCFVSLHRAEGLGLAIMESMSLGKPVIATYWSGTTDFMTPENSCPVRYKLVKCNPSFNPSIRIENLGFQGMWAEPNLSDAVNWMKNLVNNKSLCEQIGKKAKYSMESRAKKVLKGDIFKMIQTIHSYNSSDIYTQTKGIKPEYCWS